MSAEHKLSREEVLEILSEWAAYGASRHREVRAAVEAIYAENERLSGVADIYCDEAQKWSKVINDQRADVERLRGELAEAKRDAARYRWLRDPNVDVDVTMRALFEVILNDPDCMTMAHSESLRAADELDKAIDAAIERERQ